VSAVSTPERLWPRFPGVRRMEVTLFIALMVCSAIAVPSAAAQTVHGRLLEQGTARPVAAGDLTLLGEDGEAVDRAETDSAGYFTLRSPDAGSFYVRAERIGYRPKTDGVLELGEGGEITVDFYLIPQPVELEGVEGTGEGMTLLERKDREYLDWQGFYDRKKLALGHFITPEDLEERVMFDAFDLLRGIPGLDVTTPPDPRVIACAVRIDGVQVYHMDHDLEPGRGWRMASDVQVEEIAGIEIYPRGRPLQYSSVADCSPLILIWLKG